MGCLGIFQKEKKQNRVFEGSNINCSIKFQTKTKFMITKYQKNPHPSSSLSQSSSLLLSEHDGVHINLLLKTNHKYVILQEIQGFIRKTKNFPYQNICYNLSSFKKPIINFKSTYKICYLLQFSSLKKKKQEPIMSLLPSPW